MLFISLSTSPVSAYENSSYLSDEEYLEIYNAAYAQKSNIYKSTYRNDIVTMDSLRASIKTYTYSEYFKSVKWITRNGVVSLSIAPSNKLFGSTYNNANILALHAATAWELLYKKHKSNSKWKNTSSLEAQFNCHVMFAGPNKVPWNIEPHRTENNWSVVIANGCNP